MRHFIIVTALISAYLTLSVYELGNQFLLAGSVSHLVYRYQTLIAGSFAAVGAIAILWQIADARRRHAREIRDRLGPEVEAIVHLRQALQEERFEAKSMPSYTGGLLFSVSMKHEPLDEELIARVRSNSRYEVVSSLNRLLEHLRRYDEIIDKMAAQPAGGGGIYGSSKEYYDDRIDESVGVLRDAIDRRIQSLLRQFGDDG